MSPKARATWTGTRCGPELRPRAEAARSADDVRVVIREMLARIGQSHFAILPAPVASDLSGPALQSSEVGSLGFDVGPVDGHLTVTRVDAYGPAARAGIRTGWILSRVSGRSVDDALTSVADADDHVRDFRAWALGTALLRGRTGTSTDLTFLDGTGATTARQITRTPEPGYPVKFGNLPTLFARLDARPMERNGRAIGVISFNVWMTAISRSLDEAIDRFRSSKGIVLDLRGNPGGVLTMIMGVSGYFLDAPMNLGVIKTRDSSLTGANPRGSARRPVGDALAARAVLAGQRASQRVGDLHGRHAVHQARARLRHADRRRRCRPCSSAAWRRRAALRHRRFHDRHGRADRRPRRDPRHDRHAHAGGAVAGHDPSSMRP